MKKKHVMLNSLLKFLWLRSWFWG